MRIGPATAIYKFLDVFVGGGIVGTDSKVILGQSIHAIAAPVKVLLNTVEGGVNGAQIFKCSSYVLAVELFKVVSVILFQGGAVIAGVIAVVRHIHHHQAEQESREQYRGH